MLARVSICCWMAFRSVLEDDISTQLYSNEMKWINYSLQQTDNEEVALYGQYNLIAIHPTAIMPKSNTSCLLYLLGIALLVMHSSCTFTLSFPNGTTFSDPYTLTPSVNYAMNITFPTNTITAGSKVAVQFGYRYNITASTLANCQYSTAGVFQTGSCAVSSFGSGTSTVYTVTYSNIYPSTATSQSSLNLKFTITNPWGGGTGAAENILVSINDASNNVLGTGQSTLQFWPSVMNSCALTSSSLITGANSSKTISFTPVVPLIAGSTLQVSMPLWFGSLSNAGGSFTCQGITNSDAATLSCSKQSFTTTEAYTLSGFVLTDKSISSAVVLQMSPLRNPWNTYPFGPITYQLINSGIITQNCTGFSLTMTTANTFSSVFFSLPSSPSISTTYSALMVRLQVKEPFPSTGYLKITFPTTISVSFVGSTGSVVHQNTTDLILTSVATSDLTSTFSFINLFNSFDIVTPPHSRSFSITFTSLYLNSGVYYPIDSSSYAVTPITSSLAGLALTAGSYFINDATNYVVKMTTTNALTTGSHIGVLFPSTVSLGLTGSCSADIAALASCVIVNSSYVNFTSNGAVPANTAIQLTFTPVTNPNQAITTASIQIYTYYDSGLDSTVDTATSGLSLTSVARALAANSTSIVPASIVTYADTSYVVSAGLLDPIPAGGSIRVTFDGSITLGTVSLASASFATTSCTVSKSGLTVTLSSCFPTGLPAGSITFTLSGINNPPSLQPTTSLSLSTAGPSGTVNYLSTNLIITMTTPATTTTFTIAPTSSLVHATTSYTLGLTFAVPHISADYLTFSIDPSMSFVTPVCTPVSGIASINCATSNASTLVVTFNAAPQTTAQISIASIVNYDVSGVPITFQAHLFNSGGYAMESTAAVSHIYTVEAITTVSVNNNNQIALYENSNLTLTLSAPFGLHSSFDSALTQLVVALPAQFSTSASTTCLATSGVCSLNTKTFTVVPVGRSLSSFTVVMGNILLPYLAVSSTSFAIKYQFNGSDVASVSTGVTVSPFCTSPCQRCTTSQTACASCLPSTNTTFIYLFASNSSCLSVCPATYYPDNTNICQLCVSPCAECLDSANCTSCVSGNWLYLKTCAPTCPATFYNASNGKCQSCSSPCDTCLTLTQCSSCLATFFFDSSNSNCVSDTNCPAGTFANTSSNSCDSCTSPCATCHYTSATTCQSCSLGFVFFSSNSSCLISCPDGYYNNTGTCSACAPPCGFCSTLSFCTTCLTNFLNANTGQCVTSAACPNGTYPNATLKQCANCPTGCTGCSSSTQCSSCISSIYVFYNFQCLTSCPNSTYQSGSTCQDCSPTCGTCSGTATTCTSCPAPLVLQANICTSNCNIGFFNLTGTCSGCMPSCYTCSTGTTCDSCPANTYLSSNQCVSSCPSGTFKDTAAGNCTSCTGGCTTCSGSATNCSSCPSGTVLYNGTCTAGCPSNYFNISGQCLTCGNCLTCTSYTTCSQCQPGYYLFHSICYSACPATGIADPSTMTCTPCDSSCYQCTGTTTSCSSCKGGTYLYTGSCFSSCPTGLIADAATSSCTTSTLGNVVYFPCSITFLLWAIVLVYSKCNYHKTQMVTGLASGLSLILWVSWLVLVFTAASADISLGSGQKGTIAGVGMMGVACSLILGIVFNVWLKRNFQYDSGFDHWKDRNHYNLYSYRVIAIISGLTLPFFRMIYSRFFCRNNFSAFFLNGGDLFLGSNWFTVGFILFSLLPLIFCCGYLIYLKQTYDQTLIYSIDTLLLSLTLLLLLIIDMASKDESFFDEMMEEQPYLKRLKYKNLDGSMSCLRFLDQNNNPIYRSQFGDREKEDFFRKKVNCVQNVNKFGHLNTPQPEPAAPIRRVKSLPQDLSKHPQLDPNDDDDAINSQIWKQQLQRRRLKEEEEMNAKRRREEQQRLRRIEEEEEEQRKRKLKRMLEDQDQQQELEFPDLAAIEKAERKDEKNIKNSRTLLLSNFKKVQDKPIDAKAVKKLQDMSRKNGLDPTFMTETFGIEKHHNPELLNSIIDKHNHVNREAVKNLFSSSNNPEILQEMFSKKSQLDADRLRQLLNDPDSANMIKLLADKEEGIVSADIASKLLEKNSKYTAAFVKGLLSSENGMDPHKLKSLLKDNPDPAAQEAVLKALKKVGGKNLENKAVLQNMLGEESKLTAEAFVRVANDLPKQIIEQLFGTKSQANDKIISALLNNPKIDLKKLAPILQDPQIALQLAESLGAQADSDTLMRVVNNLPPDVISQLFGEKSQTNDIIINEILKNKKIDLKAIAPLLADPEMNKLLAAALSHQNPAVRQNILNMLKNGQKLDPALLKQMLSNPKLINKLLSQPIDPAFLSNLLAEGSKTDLKLLEKSLSHMKPQQIADVFGFNPERNIDFQKMAQIFEANSKSDPKLIAQLLEPQIVASLYSRNNDTKAELLNKLVQKGKKINPEEIMKIYGEDGKAADKKYLTDHKYNITDSNFNLLKGQEQSQLGFMKNENNMSRTDGVAGFLSPIHVSLAKGKNRNKGMRNIDDLSDEEVTEYQEGQDENSDQDSEYEEVNGVRRRKRRRPKRKPVDDIRLPSQQIYLQRLQAPHELQKKKNLRRKKKKNNSSSMQQLQKMDEENEVYDLDF